MNIKNIFNNIKQRYSFHFIGLSFWLILICFKFIFQYLTKIYFDPFNIMIIFFIVIFPITTVLFLSICFFLIKKENIDSNFRIKNNNIFYLIFIIISNLFSLIMFSFIIYMSIYSIDSYPKNTIIIISLILILSLIFNLFYFHKKPPKHN